MVVEMGSRIMRKSRRKGQERPGAWIKPDLQSTLNGGRAKWEFFCGWVNSLGVSVSLLTLIYPKTISQAAFDCLWLLYYRLLIALGLSGQG